MLDASRHWHRARLVGEAVRVQLNVCPGERFETVDEWLQRLAVERPRALVTRVLALRLPAAVAEAWAAAAGVGEVAMAHLSREARRALVHRLVDAPLDVRDSRGYNFAEVTAGGVPLEEIDPASMQSRVCPGLYLVGEILDVDGRLGGFNFQWAWSSAWVAGQGMARTPPR
jgi:predicted Rossmann fold flavoprotein